MKSTNKSGPWIEPRGTLGLTEHVEDLTPPQQLVAFFLLNNIP